MPTIVRVAHFDVNLSKFIGEGGFGKVFFAKDISEDPPGEIAAKQVPFGAQSEADLRREVEIMRMVSGHRSVIGFHHFEQVADHAAPEVLEQFVTLRAVADDARNVACPACATVKPEPAAAAAASAGWNMPARIVFSTLELP